MAQFLRGCENQDNSVCIGRVKSDGEINIFHFFYMIDFSIEIYQEVTRSNLQTKTLDLGEKSKHNNKSSGCCGAFCRVAQSLPADNVCHCR